MGKAIKLCLFTALLLSVSAGSDALAFTLWVQDGEGNPVQGFRWLVEEDTTYPVAPGVQVSDSLAVNIHKSYAPVVAKGSVAGSAVAIDVPGDKRYAVSVLPLEGYSMSGANVALGQDEVTVVVHRFPIPTAQISVFAFHDNQPINSAPDIPAEEGLEGFSVILADAAGQMMTDAFGNMVGTTYRQNPDGSYLTDADGNPVVDTVGTGVIRTDANGEALIKFLAPGKYGVQVVPPAGEDWIQTATIEGTPTTDAWVKAGEPPYFTEWGAFEWHVFVGFVHPMTFPDSAGTTGAITGQAVYVHNNHPPLASGLYPGVPVSGAWVGLNDLNSFDEQVYAQPCGEDGHFTIENVPPGTYQLVIWDEALDAIIDFRTVIVLPEGGTVEMGPVPVYAWFGFLEGKVFYDEDLDGYPDPVPGEAGIRDQQVVLRFPDGSIYQAAPTDPAGDYSFEEVFPFFYWLLVEVDFARYKATGMTTVVDDGGELPYEGARNNPQIDPDTGLPYRTETGEVLTQAMLLYSGQTNEIHWGKVHYEEGENGGISGIVHYATTRAEDDPRFAAAEEWEPGIPRVQVNLYADADNDGVIDDLNGDGGPTLADVDNYPFGWFEGGLKGDEDVDRDPGDGPMFNPGDALNVGWTDSWDDNLPDAVGEPQFVLVNGVPQPVVSGAETLRTWNQVRAGVFDGGYAFASHVPGGMFTGADEVDGLPNGYYIVEAVPPSGYETVKEEDKNVDFGEAYVPFESFALLALPPDIYSEPLCVGDLHLVPDELTLFPGVEAPFAGEWRPLADRKQVLLSDGENAACDFFVFTEVPKSGRIWGVVFNDVLLEFDPNNPNKGTNFAPSWMPIAIRDWRGNEVARVYTDEWGKYNALVPSTFTVNLPTPTGVSPNILTVCINDPGPIADPDNAGEYITDPWYDPAYGQICTNWEFYPGKTTRLDTPILPIGAFTANRTPLDCEFPDGTPVVYSVSGPEGGPWVPAKGGMITITSVGSRVVPNPDYDPDVPGSPTTVVRDYGFGSAPGTVTVGGVALTEISWAPDGMSIIATVPRAVRNRHQLVVTRGDNGRSTLMGITLHKGNRNRIIHVGPGDSIQDAIDSANNNSVILVAPGTYKENVIMWKPVKLQGWGAFSTVIQAGPMTPADQGAWDAKLQDLVDSRSVNLVPGERPDFYLETGAGITVMARRGRFTRTRQARIDGFTIAGAIRGGGIFVNGYANYLHISNNRIISNQGNFGGGIRIGTPSLVNARGDGYVSSRNIRIKIHNNHITQNGAVDGGGGIALFNGTHTYTITDNVICGNFSLLYGGGIAHFGLSNRGRIADNKIINNESFDEGGGIIVAGELVPAGAPAGTLTEGAGSVTIDSNLIQGNKSGDDGGGIRALMVNGKDVKRRPRRPRSWYALKVFNNIIVNNSSADAGGGIALDDAARVEIIHNTIAHNDSTSTSVDAFGGPIDEDNPGSPLLPPEAGEAGFLGGLTTSVPQVAGIAARAHSAGLQAAFHSSVRKEFSNPLLISNVIWRNRTFLWDAHYNDDWGGLRPDIPGGEDPIYWDLAVYGAAGEPSLDPRNCILTDTAGYDASNSSAAPMLVASYVNVYRATSKGAAFGNFVSVTFDPTGMRGDYHIMPGSAAVGLGDATYIRAAYSELRTDYDGESRSRRVGVDSGADEVP